ncbi:MAG: sigma-54 dependent transcriptional regulator [Elusimicrobiota bacterium]|nr:sigma-54 dependent transcriptional regulator [Elusimicrobiota bacterium]
MPNRTERILVVDDEIGMCRLLQAVLGDAGYKVTAHQKPDEALRAFDREPFDLVISDVRMPKLTGVDILQAVKSRSPDTPVILVTAFGSTRTAVEAMRLGTSDYILKPFKNEEIRLVVEGVLERRRLAAENRRLRAELMVRDGFGGLVGTGGLMREVFRALAAAAGSDEGVLLEGAPGTGKDLAARSLHWLSRRAADPFTVVDCAAFTEARLETELFGRFQGTFAAAQGDKAGALAATAGGTLLLKNAEALTPASQAKVLRFIQESKIRRPGSLEAVTVDLRIMAASRDLSSSVAGGRFREDLFARLAATRVRLPSLIERREDIVPLAGHILSRIAKRSGRAAPALAPEAAASLSAHGWPGNVGELEKVLAHAFALAAGRIEPAHLPAPLSSAPDSMRGKDLPAFREAKQLVLESFEKDYLRRLLKQADGNITRAAEIAGMDRKNLYDLLKKHDLAPR